VKFLRILAEDAMKYRNELVERIVEHDDAAHERVSRGQQSRASMSSKTLRKAVIKTNFPVY
jgi:translation elongation factor EF-G